MSILSRRVRGFRLVDLVGLSLLVLIILGVYLAKTMAGRERAEIARVERQIGQEKARIRLLRAEVAHLEQPSRIGNLSSMFLGLQPASMKREITSEELQLAMAKPQPVVVIARPVAATPAAVEPPTEVVPTLMEGQ